MSTHSKIASLWNEYVLDDEARLRSKTMQTAFTLVESPIEQLFVAAIFLSGFTVLSQPNAETRFTLHSPDPGLVWGWGAQMQIKKYRVDFVFCDGHHMVVVECDGHDFHERTKEQAARDRSRDRWLTASGFTVLRFTGSQIYADPKRCVAEVIDTTERISQRFGRTAG